MSDPKPCPICNGKTSIATNRNGFYRVQCNKLCVCQGFFHREKEMAVEAWNRRAKHE